MHVGSENQIERFVGATDPSLAGICSNTGHHAYRGGDVLLFTRPHHDRIPIFHVKNVDPNEQRRVEDERIPFARAGAMDMFVEPSVGTVDFSALCDLVRDINYEGYAVVEQDMHPAPFDKPLPIARRTREYLQKIGTG
jgi:inosose dehydratase